MTGNYINTENSQDYINFENNLQLVPPTNENTEERLKQIDALKYFLATATNEWDEATQIKTFPLPTGESISCVIWQDLFHMTGTDIVRCLIYRFHLFGRPVSNLKKFEEGIFSDLRNLKPGMDASLQEPKSPFLDMLYKHNCIRTQKKQKVFFWFSVPHDRLFLDALERDLKREKLGQEPTTIAVAEPAISMSLDTTQDLFDQLRKSMSLSAVAAAHALDENLNELNQITASINSPCDKIEQSPLFDSPKDWNSKPEKIGHRSTRSLSSISMPSELVPPLATVKQTSYSAGTSPKLTPADPFEIQSPSQQKIFGAFSLFEGSPTYKQRQRRRTCSTFIPRDELSSSVDPHHLFHVLRQQQLAQQELPDKTYVCPLKPCARVFKRLEHLKRHFRTHTLERPYGCSMCGKHFSRTDNLAQHKRTHNRNKHLSIVIDHRTDDTMPAMMVDATPQQPSDDDDYLDTQHELFYEPWQPTTESELDKNLSWYSLNHSFDPSEQQVYPWYAF